MDLGHILAPLVLTTGSALLVLFVVAPRTAERHSRELVTGAYDKAALIALIGWRGGGEPPADRR